MSAPKYSDVFADFIFTPEMVLKQYKRMTNDQLAIAITTPGLCETVIAVVSKLSDSQLQAIIPLASTEHVRSIVPKLQLQQNGVAFQAMSPDQIRTGISALPGDDRSLLMQNIALLTSTSSKEELQSFVAFIDPLAMCIAIGLEELSQKIINYAGVLTIEQLRLVVPMMNTKQIQNLLIVLEEENQISVAISMIDSKDALAKLLIQDLAILQRRKQDIVPRLKNVTDTLQDIETRISSLASVTDKKTEYEALVKTVRSVKTEVESLQQLSREVQAAVKVPLKILSEKDHTEPFKLAQAISTEVAQFSKTLYSKFATIDGFINTLNAQRNTIESSSSSSERNMMKASTDDDDDIAVSLHAAVKEIGNPDAIGNHYKMTWNDIIQAGFRSATDFKEKRIQNLEQLQNFINKQAK